MATELTSNPVSPDAALRLMLRCDSLAAAFTRLGSCFPAETARIDRWEARLTAIPIDNGSVEDIAHAGREALTVSAKIRTWFLSMGVESKAPEFRRIRRG